MSIFGGASNPGMGRTPTTSVIRLQTAPILLLCVALSFAGNALAQKLMLDQGPPMICRVHSPADEWLPAPKQIAALERALPVFLALQASKKEKMPTPDLEYARQYSGIVRDGKKFISGRYYPKSNSRPFFAQDGVCWMTMDGGPSYWNVEFDPESGKIISFMVNGIA